MTDLEYCFEPSAWDLALQKLKSGGSISAVRLLTFFDEAEDSELDNALGDLLEKGITLRVDDLPAGTADGQISARLQMEKELAKQADLCTGLDENDPLRLYLEELASIPAVGDAGVLALELANGDTAVIDRLVNLLLSRVVDIAREYTDRGVLFLDLIQEGSLGLWQGLQTYHGGDIYEYCDWWIRQYMAGSVTVQAKISGLGQMLRQGVADFRDADQQLLMQLGRNPTTEEIAVYLHITPEQAASLEETLQAARLLHKAKAEPEDSPQDEAAPVEDTAYFQMRQRIGELLSALEPEDARLLTLRYGLEGGLPKTAEQVAAELGLTAQQVTAKEAAALAKLRQEQ